MLNPGDRFGDYRVLKMLGKGGMGAVFLLENAEGAQVAAKILDPTTAGDHESRKRFLREAELALGVKHPNLVETYDVGEEVASTSSANSYVYFCSRRSKASCRIRAITPRRSAPL